MLILPPGQDPQQARPVWDPEGKEVILAARGEEVEGATRFRAGVEDIRVRADLEEDTPIRAKEVEEGDTVDGAVIAAEVAADMVAALGQVDMVEEEAMEVTKADQMARMVPAGETTTGH